MSPCPACIARGKTWEGQDPTCAFPGGADFMVDNWNCATMNRLREGASALGVSWRDDMGFGSFAALPVYGNGDEWAFVVVLGWYKDRGRTAVARVMGDEQDEVLTAEVALHALAYVEREIARRGAK